MKYRLIDDPVLKAEAEALSLEELLRCVTCPNLVADHDPSITHTLSVFIHPTTRDKAHDLITKINSGGSRTLFVTDMECGPGTALKGTTAFPSMRAAMQSHDPKLAYQMGACAAVEGRNAGFSWTFGPCVDIAGYHDSPITSIRSAGETARVVLTYAGNYWQGLQDYGMIATLKHFPGDGYCVNDQHLTTAVNPLDRGEWDQSFGLIYRHLIDQGAKAIMPGHIALPCYDTPDKTSGLYRPATLSKRILTDLLREKLGFEGIIMSDAVNMSGFCGYMNYYQACAEFLESGGDCLLFAHPDDEFITEMKKMIDEG
nr:hypothetical protein [Candidatus Delongbacteria bacterium]